MCVCSLYAHRHTFHTLTEFFLHSTHRHIHTCVYAHFHTHSPKSVHTCVGKAGKIHILSNLHTVWIGRRPLRARLGDPSVCVFVCVNQRRFNSYQQQEQKSFFFPTQFYFNLIQSDKKIAIIPHVKSMIHPLIWRAWLMNLHNS